MRTLLAAALALAAVPALAQDVPDRSDGPAVLDSLDRYRFEIERDEDGSIIFRRDGGEEVRLRLPGSEELERFGGVMNQRLLYRDFFDGGPERFLRGLSGEPGVSPETRERMRSLEAEARDLARRARDLDGSERRDAERRLDAVLDELFDVRAEARRERADGLRERARELEAEAAEVEAALRDREARREAIIGARRAELLGETDSDW